MPIKDTSVPVNQCNQSQNWLNLSYGNIGVHSDIEIALMEKCRQMFSTPLQGYRCHIEIYIEAAGLLIFDHMLVTYIGFRSLS